MKMSNFIDEQVVKAKMYFRNAISMQREDLMEDAWLCWCNIYMYFETPEGAPEDERMRASKELAEVMARFTDDEVYGITDYAKKKYSA